MTKLKTGRHTSALKEVRKTIKRCKTNAYIKSKLKTSIKKFKILLQNDNEKNILLIKKQLSLAFSQLDKAANKNVIHYNKASNQKKRLTHLLKSINIK
jgi:small subunit ribosomal protein S20